jgi:hypothetical protein
MPYFRIRSGYEEHCAILFGYRSEDDLSFLCDDPCLTAEAAGDVFARYVNKINSSRGGNPISSSRSWALPSREHTGWDVVAVGPTQEEVRRTAELLGIATRVLSIGGEPMMVCHGETLSMDALCEALSNLSTTEVCSFNTDTDMRAMDDGHTSSWRGYPDEEPDPYRVGAVT